MKYKIVNTPWNERTAINMTRVIASEAGDCVIEATQFYRLGMLNMGVQIQATLATVTPSFTLSPPEVALSTDPDVAATAVWKALDPVVPGNMTLYPLATTAIKLTFSGEGEAAVVSF